jgi:hypothetical protein
MLAVYIIVGVVVLLCTCFLIPIDIVVDYKSGDEAGPTAELKWLFGLLKFNLPGKRLRLRRQRTRKQRFVRIRHIGNDFRVLSSIIKLVRKTIHAVKVKKLSGYIKLGLNSPAETAIVFALIQAIAAMFSVWPKASFRIEPVFTAPAFDAEIEGKIRVSPFRVATNTSRFIFSRDGWYLIRYIIRRRRS